MIKNKILNNSGLKYYKILRFYGGRKIPFVLLLSAVASLAEGIGFIVVIVLIICSLVVVVLIVVVDFVVVAVELCNWSSNSFYDL